MASLKDKEELLAKIESKEAIIGIVGLGYVGLPLVLRFSEVGFRVLGLDVDPEKTKFLNQGKSYIKHISEDGIKMAVQNGFYATTDMSEARRADALLLCVPTPLTKQNQPDLTFVIDTMEGLLPYLRKGQVISLESTTYPGTTEEELQPRIKSTGLKIGEEIFLVFSPEREDPGNRHFNVRTIPKVCSGQTQNCKEVAIALYGAVVDQVVPVSSTRAAEMTKLLENIHRAVNIGLVNELKMVADRMGIDIHEVIKAAATKPFGFVPYYPGPGLGGHCIPIDPFYLTWKAREYGVHTRFIELAGEINEEMPRYVINKTIEALNKRKKSLKNAKILVLGISYKKNIDDIRESPSVSIMELLREYDACISYCDPYFPEFPKMRAHSFDLKSVQLTSENVSKYDAIIISTAHDCFDYGMLKEKAALIIDTRGVYASSSDNVVKA